MFDPDETQEPAASASFSSIMTHDIRLDAAQRPSENGPESNDKRNNGRTLKQPWPGSDQRLLPQADHGETSYQGTGKLAGRVALVTGGDSGIGRAVAIAYAREGADVCITYFNEHDDARKTTELIERAGRRALAIAGDLTDRDHCQHVVQRTITELGHLDILVNNAAFQMEADDLAKIPMEQIEQSFRTNILAPIWLTQAALDHLDPGSVILNTGSITAMEGSPTLIDYSATKGALHTLTKSLARALADRGIRVNCVAPGPVWTPLIPSTLDAEHVAEFGRDTLLQRPAQPAEIAPTYVLLASDEGRYYTGEILAPTGRAASR
jgi:hypothetical protein